MVGTANRRSKWPIYLADQPLSLCTMGRACEPPRRRLMGFASLYPSYRGLGSDPKNPTRQPHCRPTGGLGSIRPRCDHGRDLGWNPRGTEYG
ncbi:hypothetical protein ppKF707_0958 [Metapseudomonas furukawaii]|uniref:Uncharacterized protein n=1 Tax=Metapseudomonas furukawaii TaxID=1149133 RepID=A0AAD1FGA4_METFU|nr:hypothetical protein ppKF707_0958 [Pseudomonas furukawaii]BAU75371.1 hypothetical protein KF707C_36830 [Pseudomonas furukawaii]